MAVIVGTHIVIDRFSLAKRWKRTGFAVPESLEIWVPIVVDQAVHLTINYLALRYL